MRKIEHIVFRPKTSSNVMLHSRSAPEGGLRSMLRLNLNLCWLWKSFY